MKKQKIYDIYFRKLTFKEKIFGILLILLRFFTYNNISSSFFNSIFYISYFYIDLRYNLLFLCYRINNI